jgi:predicted phage terminase large subunit-like protein
LPLDQQGLRGFFVLIFSARKKEKMKEKPKVYGPCSEKQRMVLQDNTTDILITGGGAGSGKTMTCLMKAMRICLEDKNARILITRRSFPQLKITGGMIDESKKMYPGFGAKFKVMDSKWIWPNGATIQFAPIPDDPLQWQGLQATHILVDEIAEFTEEEVLFLQGRIRGAEYKGHTQLIGTCNPSRDSFLFKWVEFSLDMSTGIPKPGTEDITRYLINVNGAIHWGNSIEELWEAHGVRLNLTREYVGNTPPSFQPKSFRYIPMLIYDNPVLLKNNPGYLGNLLAQPRVNQLRYVHGSWTAREEGAGYFRREWVKIVDYPPVNPVSRVRAWDLAATTPSESNKNPDWTAGVLMSRDKYGIYYIEHVNRFRKLTDGVLQEIVKTANIDGHDTRVTIPRDTGAGGKTANAFFLRHLAENGVAAKSVVMSGHSGKVQRFLPFCTLAESGAVRIVRGDWNEEFLTELECFENSRNQKDD